MSTAQAKNLLARAKSSHSQHDRDAIGHLIDALDELLKSNDVQRPHAAVDMGSIHTPPVSLGNL